MSQTWSIMIKGNVPANFDADVFGIDPGQPLKAQITDLVSWNNQTNVTHQIQVNDPRGLAKFTTKEIEAGKSSTPGYALQAEDKDNPNQQITYICTKHAGESGKIQVVTS